MVIQLYVVMSGNKILVNIDVYVLPFIIPTDGGSIMSGESTSNVVVRLS